MSKTMARHGHDSKPHRGTRAKDAKHKSGLPVRTSSHTMTSKAVDVKPTATNTTENVRKDTGLENGAGKTPDEPVASPAARTSTRGERNGRSDTGEPFKLCTALPSAISHPTSTAVSNEHSPSKNDNSPSQNEKQSPYLGPGKELLLDAKKQKSPSDVFQSLANLEIVRTQPPVSDDSMKNTRLSPRKAAVFVTGLGVYLFLSFAYLLFTAHNTYKKLYRICDTSDCYRHVTLLTESINWTLDPCDDFQAFVCSAWEPSKQYGDMIASVIDDLRFAWYEKFWDTLQKGSVKLSAGNKPLAMYDMCRNNYPYNKPQIRLLRALLDASRLGWPEPREDLQPPLGLLVRLSYYLNWPFWITVNMMKPTRMGRHRLLVRKGMALPIMWNQHRSVYPYYISYWKQFLTLFYPDSATRPNVKEEDINEIRDIEADVLSTLNDASKSADKTPAAFSFSEIGRHVLNASVTEWVRDFQYGTLLRPQLTVEDWILTSDVIHLEAVCNLMEKYSKRQLNAHIAWMVVQQFALCADYSFLVGYTGSKETAEQFLPAFCGFHVEGSFKVLISALAYFSRFTPQDRETIDNGFRSLVLAAVDKVNSSSWMTEEAKLQAIRKLSSLNMSFWPQESLLNNNELQRLFADFPMKESSFAHFWVSAHTALLRVNRTPDYNEALMLLDNYFPHYAGYDDFTNYIELAMAVASPPAFYSNGTNAMLYGGLFFVMAMQMVNAIDYTSVRWTYNETVNDDFLMSADVMGRYSAMTMCQHGEKNESIFPEVPAVEVAYAALKKSHRGMLDEPLLLDEQLPEDKVFFMTLCYLMCSRPGYQSPIEADCNKVVRNSGTFAQVYSCPKGAKMNPERKCSFFT